MGWRPLLIDVVELPLLAPITRAPSETRPANLLSRGNGKER
jgi:hypothetical protein